MSINAKSDKSNVKFKAKSKLTKIRKKAGLTQAQLAVLVGVTTNTIQNWEKANGLAQLEKYLKLGEIFGLDNLKELVEYVETTEEEDQKELGFSFEDLRQLRQSWGINVETQSTFSNSLVLNNLLNNNFNFTENNCLGWQVVKTKDTYRNRSQENNISIFKNLILDDDLKVNLKLYIESLKNNLLNILVSLNVTEESKNYLPERIKFMITDDSDRIIFEALPKLPEIGRILNFEAEQKDKFNIIVTDKKINYRESFVV